MSSSPPRVLTFELKRPTITLNELLALRRAGDWKVSAYKKALGWEMRLALAGQLPAVPFARARLLIERHSPGVPDEDGLWGGLKPLIDLLLPEGTPTFPKGRRKPRYPHPYGLGIVADDNSRVLKTEVRAVRSTRAGAKTIVTITEEFGDDSECVS